MMWRDSKMNYMVWVLLILYVMIGVGVAVGKKGVMNATGEITLKNFYKIQTWINLFTNPWTILILTVSVGLFGMSMWIFSMTDANNVILAAMIVGLPMTLFNIFLNNRILGENVLATQYVPITLVGVGYALMVTGVWYFVGGVK